MAGHHNVAFGPTLCTLMVALLAAAGTALAGPGKMFSGGGLEVCPRVPGGMQCSLGQGYMKGSCKKDGKNMCRGNCCMLTGYCPSSSCEIGPGWGTNQLGEVELNCVQKRGGGADGSAVCPVGNPAYNATCDISAYNAACTYKHCLGKIKCRGKSCPQWEGLDCFMDGNNSDNFKVCGCPARKSPPPKPPVPDSTSVYDPPKPPKAPKSPFPPNPYPVPDSGDVFAPPPPRPRDGFPYCQCNRTRTSSPWAAELVSQRWNGKIKRWVVRIRLYADTRLSSTRSNLQKIEFALKRTVSRTRVYIGQPFLASKRIPVSWSVLPGKKPVIKFTNLRIPYSKGVSGGIILKFTIKGGNMKTICETGGCPYAAFNFLRPGPKTTCPIGYLDTSA